MKQMNGMESRNDVLGDQEWNLIPFVEKRNGIKF